MGLGQFVKSIYQGRPSNNIVYTRYPALAVGAALTASGLTTGVYKYAAAGANEVQLLAAKAIATPFWVAGGGIETMSVVGVFVLKVCSGLITAGVQLFEIQIAAEIVTAVGHFNVNTHFVPVPVGLAANVPVCCDLASNNAAADDTANGHIVCYV